MTNVQLPSTGIPAVDFILLLMIAGFACYRVGHSQSIRVLREQLEASGALLERVSEELNLSRAENQALGQKMHLMELELAEYRGRTDFAPVKELLAEVVKGQRIVTDQISRLFDNAAPQIFAVKKEE